VTRLHRPWCAGISQLGGIDRPVLEDTKLVASKLVSNAVRHSWCTDQQFLNVPVSGDRWLRVSVFDPGRHLQDREPSLSAGRPGFEGGRARGQPVGRQAAGSRIRGLGRLGAWDLTAVTDSELDPACGFSRDWRGRIAAVLGCLAARNARRNPINEAACSAVLW
jgi:hypothetical protein